MWALTGRGGGVAAEVRTTFAPDGDGTLVHASGEYHPLGFFRLLFPFFRGQVRRSLADGLGRLKQSVEAGA